MAAGDVTPRTPLADAALHAQAESDDQLLAPDPRSTEGSDAEPSFAQLLSNRFSYAADLPPVAAHSLAPPPRGPKAATGSSELVPPASMDLCSICSAKLGKRVLRPRHHCRLCNRLVCGQCCPSQMPLGGHQGRQIVCRDCTSIVEKQQKLTERLLNLASRLQGMSSSVRPPGDLNSSCHSLQSAVALCEEEAARLEQRYAAEVLRAEDAERRLRFQDEVEPTSSQSCRWRMCVQRPASGSAARRLSAPLAANRGMPEALATASPQRHVSGYTHSSEDVQSSMYESTLSAGSVATHDWQQRQRDGKCVIA